ncbi:ATP-binding protein [Streptomyces sp. NPDC003730]
MGVAAGEVIGVSGSDGDCAEWVFPAAPDAVRGARSLVRRTLDEWRLDSVEDLTVLLVSELVTNALRHATGPIGVRLCRPAVTPGILLVEVSDPLPELPRERVARPDDEDGRGLQLVASVTHRWGTRPGEAGKTVWFELAVPQ